MYDPKVISIEGIEEGPPLELDQGDFFMEEFPEVSLNAITGTPTPKTMRTVGILRTRKWLF